MSSPIRVRFAPSPTGYLHVGGARSALFNWLFARHTGGTFILRIEDTDRSRYVEGALQEIFESLRWLGLEWDEGPEIGGGCGPYFQSERTALYKEYAQILIDRKHAYRCFCTAERLAALRADQEKNKLPLGYDRKCRDLSQTQIDRLLEAGTPFVIRLKIPGGRSITFADMIRGAIAYESDVLDDIVLIKSDGFPTYHMANVVDDHLMGITHVLRGDEWIASTPRHVLLYEAFDWTMPSFAHLPIILAEDGKKLSKRKGAASVMDYKWAGYLPEALFNFLALLGWAPGEGDEREKMSVGELTEAFSIERISPKAAVFDEKKLEWMNGVYLAEKPAESLVSELFPLWKEYGWIDTARPVDDPFCLSVIDLLKVRSKKVTELAQSAGYFFIDPLHYEEKAAKNHFGPNIIPLLSALVDLVSNCPSFDPESLESAFRAYAGQTNRPAGHLIHPARLAVTGVSFGPGLFELMTLLGRETVVRRMKAAIAHIEQAVN
ncbi:MAG: glutamate--tRNA ligase [Chitinispirillaceae bacterium]|nr:glutamate--tRNA ligase [Chitinispirillaceae bacterium]